MDNIISFITENGIWLAVIVAVVMLVIFVLLIFRTKKWVTIILSPVLIGSIIFALTANYFKTVGNNDGIMSYIGQRWYLGIPVWTVIVFILPLLLLLLYTMLNDLSGKIKDKREEKKERGEKERGEKEKREKIAEIEKRIEKLPNRIKEDTTNYILKGDTQYDASQLEDALKSYSTAIEKGCNDCLLFFKRGEIYGKLNLHSNAIIDYTIVISINSLFSKAYFNRSFQYSEINQLDDAIKDISQYIEQMPKDCEGYFLRGLYYWKKDRYDRDRAIKELSTSIKVLPNKNAYSLLGTIYSYEKKYENALPNYLEAYKISPNDVVICEGLGKTLFHLYLKDEAMPYLLSAIKLNSSDKWIFFYMGVINQERGEFGDAILYYQKTILMSEFGDTINGEQDGFNLKIILKSHFDDFDDAHSKLGQCYIALGQIEKGLEELNNKDNHKKDYALIKTVESAIKEKKGFKRSPLKIEES